MPELSEMFANPGPRWLQTPNVGQPAEWLAKGYAMGNERRQFDIYQQRLKDIDALNKRSKDQEYELNVIALKNQIDDREQMIASEGAYSKVARMYADHRQTGIAGTDQSDGEIAGALADNTAFFRHPGAKSLLSEMQISRESRERQLTRLLPNAADEAAIYNQLAREEQVSITTTGQPWTPEQRAKRAAELGQLKDFKPAFKGGIAFDDQGRIQQVTFGDQPTVATASFVQKNLNIAEKNYQLLDDLDKNLRSADLGIRGVLGEVVDRYAPQFGLPGFDPKRATNREVLKVSVQGMVRQISSDTRFTEADRKRAEDAMVSFGAGENKERATEVLGTLKDIIRSRSKIDAETGGMPQPDWTFSPDEITRAVQSGKMPKEKGVELRLRYYPEIYGPASR